MDDEQFAALTSRLTEVLSRRRLGPVLGGLGLSGGLGLALAGDSVAKKGKKRKKGKKACKACESGETKCSETCIDTRTDAQNCGRCDASCGAGEVCVESLCWTPCPEATVCEVGGTGPKFCSPGVFCVGVAGTAVCAASAGSCDVAIDCTDTPCPAGTGCAALCCGFDIDAHCMAPG